MNVRWWRLAARNLTRHRRRTLLTGSIVVVGFIATTMTAGFVSQTFSSLATATIRGLGGHLRIVDPRAAGKTDDEAAAFLISDWSSLAKIAKESPHVLAVMPKLSFFGLVVKGEKSAAYLGTGAIPELEKSSSLSADTVSQGVFFEDPEGDDVMLGSGLAKALGASVGDLVTVMTTTPDGSLNAIDATVRTILVYPIKDIDDRLLFMPYAPASHLLKSAGKASSVVVMLRGGIDASTAAEGLRERFQRAKTPVVIRTWLETAAFYKQVRLLYISIFFFMGLVLAIVVILAVANTMTMSVFERTKEIGTLLAIGMDRRVIRGLFLKEGALLGLLGSLVGAVLSLILRLALNASGIELPPPPGGTHGNILHVDLIPLAYAMGFGLMTTTLLVASWWPARRASRLDPVVALSHA